MSKLEIKDTDNGPEVLIYDDIGPEWAGMIGVKTVESALKSIGTVDSISVRINSGGGDVFESFGIYNILVGNSADIITHVDGVAASGASVIAMAGNEIHIAENAMIMIHNAWTFAAGNKGDLEDVVSLLSKVDSNLADIYHARTGVDKEEIETMLDAETWMTSAEAVDKGFADHVTENLNVAASVRKGRFKNTPSQFVIGDAVDKQDPETPVDPPVKFAAGNMLRKIEIRRRRMGV